MPVTRRPILTRGALALAMVALLGCGDDDSSPGVGTNGRKDASAGLDAALDAALDADVGEPPQGGSQSPKPDAGRHPTAGSEAPPPQPDGSTPPPTCASLNCEAMSDECNVVTCNPKTIACVTAARPDGTACGSDVLDNCSAPDECRAGVCEPRHAAAGTACGDRGVDCQLDDACDGEGHCLDNGPAPEDTPCGDQTPSDPDCDAPNSCDANGVCQPRYAPLDTPCGDESVACRFDDKCDGFGSCQDGGFWSAGACPNGEVSVLIDNVLTTVCACGRIDQGECHPDPDVCIAGSCDLGNSPDGTACGSSNDTVCDNPDKCLSGLCAPNHEPPGLTCGDQSTNTTCNHKDACDGGGNCDPNYAGTDVVCGTSPGECADAPHCNGSGSCGSPEAKTPGTPCGSAIGECYLPRECNGGTACPAAVPADPGTPCGNQTAGDPQCDAPDSCDGAGVCNPRHATTGTECGDQSITECSQPDSCDASGACNRRDDPSGTACGDQGLTCRNDDSCNGSGACVDHGYVSPCSLSGTVTADGTGVAGVTVQILGTGATSTVTDANGDFTLDAPLGQEVLLRVSPVAGYWGQIRARTFTANDIDQSLDLSLQADDSVIDAANALALPVSTSKGMVIVFVMGSGLSGDEGATLSSPSSPSIADAGGNYQYADTIVTPGSGGGLYFYNADPSAGSTVTPIDSLTRTCTNASSITSFPVIAHTISWVTLSCQ